MARKATKKIPIRMSPLRLNRLSESLFFALVGTRYYSEKVLPKLVKSNPWRASEVKAYKDAVSDLKELKRFAEAYDDATAKRDTDDL